jgi:hypothetical protein
MSSLHRRLPFVLLAVVYASLVTSLSPAAEPGAGLPSLQFPQIEKYGSVVALPDAGERIRSGGKIYFDTTAAAPAGPSPTVPHRSLPWATTRSGGSQRPRRHSASKSRSTDPAQLRGLVSTQGVS